MSLSSQPLCTHPNCDECRYYIYLVYKSTGAAIQLPDGYPPAPCDFCDWKVRDLDFFDKGDW